MKQKDTIQDNDKKEILMEAGKLCFDFGKLIFGGVILVGIIETKLSRKPLFWISVFFSTYFPCIRIHLVLDGNPKKIKTLWN